MHSIVLYGENLHVRARQWSELPDAELKRRAKEAAHLKDPKILWGLTEAHLLQYGRKGSTLSEHTLSTYRDALNTFLDYASKRAVNLLNPARDTGAQYKMHLEQTYQPASVRVKLAGVRALYRALRWAGATNSEPLVDVKSPVDSTPAWEKVRPYPPVSVQLLLDHATLKQRVMVLLGAHAGLRAEEAVELEWKKVDLQALTLTVTGKGKKVGTLKISRSLAAALQQLKTQGAEGKVIGGTTTNLRQVLKRLCKRAGVTYLGYHALRKAAGTRLYAQVKDLEDVTRFMRHTSVDTSRRYVEWSKTNVDDKVGEW